MKISKDKLFQIVREEIANHFKALTEAPEVADASSEPEKKDKDKKSKDDPKSSKSAPKTGEQQKAADQELPDTPDDEKISKDADEPAETADEEQTKVQQALVGKTVQSVSYEPKSKVLPGAQEINLTFNEMPDPLKILVTHGGEIKYFFKGQLHNKL